MLAALAVAGCSQAETEAGGARISAVKLDHSYAGYARLLASYVQGARVDYAGLKSDRAALDSVVAMIADAELTDASTQQRLAFYINAYNILTLRSIVAAYPVKSIKDIDGVWQKKWRVAGRELSLDQIENQILRVEFSEPRIHVAINCASISCPPLRGEPYRAERIEEQLTEASRGFATSNHYNQLLPTEGKARISMIFDWFGGDFVEQFYQPGHAAKLSKEKNAALSFLIKYSSLTDSVESLPEEWEVSFIEYDWGLNEIPNDAR